MSENKVLAGGNAYIDINLTRLPFGQEGIPVERELGSSTYTTTAGGSAANFTRICASLGLDPTFVGRVGRDEMGELFAQKMEAAGVHTKLVIGEEETNLDINLVNKEGQMVSVWAGQANQALTPSELAAAAMPVLAESNFLYLGGTLKLPQLMPAFYKLVKAATEQGVQVVVDHNRVPHGPELIRLDETRALALSANYYFPSRDEFLEVWQVKSIEAGLRKVLGKKAAVRTVVKDGENGAFALENGELVHVPAFPVKVIDTNGAGDSFNAGFIAARVEGKDLRESMRFACAVAALKISQPELPTPEQVRTLLGAQ